MTCIEQNGRWQSTHTHFAGQSGFWIKAEMRCIDTEPFQKGERLGRAATINRDKHDPDPVFSQHLGAKFQ